MVPGTGIEPVRPYEHEILSLGCLPVSPSGQRRRFYHRTLRFRPLSRRSYGPRRSTKQAAFNLTEVVATRNGPPLTGKTAAGDAKGARWSAVSPQRQLPDLQPIV